MNVNPTTALIDNVHGFLLQVVLPKIPATGLLVLKEIFLRASLLGATDGGSKMATLVIFGIRFFTLI